MCLIVKTVKMMREDSLAEIKRECEADPYGLSQDGMIGRIQSTYGLNVESMGHDKAVRFVADTYNFTIDTVADIVSDAETHQKGLTC